MELGRDDETRYRSKLEVGYRKMLAKIVESYDIMRTLRGVGKFKGSSLMSVCFIRDTSECVSRAGFRA